MASKTNQGGTKLPTNGLGDKGHYICSNGGDKAYNVIHGRPWICTMKAVP